MLDARKTFRPDDPLRALGIRAEAAARLDDSQRAAIAARLMTGEAPEAVIAALARTGTPLALAQREVAAASDHPYVRGAATLAARLAKRDWVLDCRARMECMAQTGIPRRDRLDADRFFEEHYARLAPVVLTGLTDHWPARRWTLETLAARVGNPEIEVQWARAADPDFELNSIAHKKRMRWHAVLAMLADDPETNDFYVTANNGGVNRQALAALWQDFGDLPGYLGRSPLGDGFFWMGPRGTITPWHHDLTQNLLVNMVGTKRVSLVSPAQTPAMRNHRHCFSDFGADPTPEGVPVQTVDIGPGDILFIPVGWWHHVRGLSRTIGMSFTNFVWPNEFPASYPMDREL